MASRPTRQRVDVTSASFRRCESQKVGHATYAEALDAAEAMMLRGHVLPGCHITPYRCDRCPEWHNANRVIVAVSARQRAIARAEGAEL